MVYLSVYGDDIKWLKYFGVDFLLLIGKLQCDFGLFCLGWSLVEFSPLDWRVGLGVEKIPKFHFAYILGLRPPYIDIASFVAVGSRSHVLHHQVLLYDPLLQNYLCLHLLLRHLRVFTIHPLAEGLLIDLREVSELLILR